MPRVARPLAAAVAGAALARAALPVLARALPEQLVIRTNHAGRQVTLTEGAAYVLAGAGAGMLAGPASVIATAGAGGFGAVDDLAQDRSNKGLAGHLGALRRGRLTTGAAKVLGIGATGLVAAWAADRTQGRRSVMDTLVGGGVIAGAANLANLLDLRPGRALKASLLAAAPLALGSGAGATAGGAAIGVGVALLPEDLAGTAMLGDTGANAAGALVGSALVQSLGRPGRVVALAVLVVLTLASERVSFTAVIESTPVLRELDAWGR